MCSKYLPVFFIVCFFIISGCRSVPYTDRGQLMLVSEKTDIAMGEKGFKEVQAEATKSFNDEYNNAVLRVGRRIAAVAQMKDFKWQFLVVKSKEANAFCMPGGKVVVYTGLFSFVHNDGELATVLGHEIGHAIARHGAETISRDYVENAGGVLIGIASSIVGIPGTGLAYGAITQFGVELPFSREQEYEADYIGLMLMAKAGYDPRTALVFWNTFSKEANYGPVKEFFTTHPMGSKRIEQLKELMPKALKLYNDAMFKYGTGEKIN